MMAPRRIAVGSGGRAVCALCAAATRAAYDPTPTVLGRIDAALRAGEPVGGIMLGGADAFGHPELPSLIARAVRRGAARIGLETDGGPLTAGDNAAGAIHAGARRFEVRLLVAEDVFAERPGAARSATVRALRGIEACVAAGERMGVPVVASAVVPVCAHSLEGLAATVAALAAAGAAGARLDARGLVVTARASASLTAACDTGMVDGVWVDVLGDAGLLPASHALHLAEEEPA